MNRRQLITLLGGAAAAWPLAARAQQAGMPVVGFLHSTSLDADDYRLRPFRQGLKDAGFIEGENVAVDYRWADDQIGRLPALATELVRRQVAVIVAGNTVAAFAAKTATTTIPIAFATIQDPVALGLVTSLARPDGNLTGINWFASELAAKRLELLRELVPGAARVALLVQPANVRITESTVKEVQAARSLSSLPGWLNDGEPGARSRMKRREVRNRARLCAHRVYNRIGYRHGFQDDSRSNRTA